MAAKSAAQEEFDSIIQNASAGGPVSHHPDDSEDYKHDRDHNDREEEDEYIQRKLDETMRLPSLGYGNGQLRLPPKEFDRGRTTGVKGVIADARSYEEAKKSSTWRSKGTQARSRSRVDKRTSSATFLKDEGEGSEEEDEDEDEEFLERWRVQRRMELQKGGNDIRNRRSSPSVRRFGRLDSVDAMGYLDAIEKVGRDTVVVVFVYDHECAVSEVISDALIPLVASHPAVHFVRVHYEDIEFDNAGVPAILAYKNQGDLFANLTYIIDQIPDETLFDTKALETILRKHQVL